MPKVTARQLLDLLQKQGFKCALTGRALTPDDCSLDHVVPRSKGGPHEIGNCQLVVAAANQAKGTMTHEEFVNLCRDVVRVHGLQ